jgi:hypothetical protein
MSHEINRMLIGRKYKASIQDILRTTIDPTIEYRLNSTFDDTNFKDPRENALNDTLYGASAVDIQRTATEHHTSLRFQQSMY